MNNLITFTEEFLFLIDKNKNDIARKKWGKIPELTYYELIYTLLTHNNLVEVALSLGLDDKTVQRLLKKLFPEVSIMGSSWGSYILSCINYKKCSKCNTIQAMSEFHKDSSSLNDVSSWCKNCSKQDHIKNKETNNIRSKLHYLNNKQYYLNKSILRKNSIHTPPWANIDEINKIYRERPEGYHVDHIIPLKGRLVSGLHVENNLQYLSVYDNLSKSNNYEIC